MEKFYIDFVRIQQFIVLFLYMAVAGQKLFITNNNLKKNIFVIREKTLISLSLTNNLFNST